MRIGIFGCSFAEPHESNLGWPGILQEHYGLDVQNFALYSTSLYWAYTQLLKYIDDNDTIIFSVTGPERLYHNNIDYRSISSLFTINSALASNRKFTKVQDKDELSDHDKQVFKAARDYYLYLEDGRIDFDDFVAEQIIKEVRLLAKEKNKPLVIVPAFTATIKYQSIFTVSLLDIMQKELLTNFNNCNFIKEKYPARLNHMSLENNKILADKLVGLLSGSEEKINLDDFVFIKYENPELYWEI